MIHGTLPRTLFKSDALDIARSYLSDAPSPVKFAAIWKRVDAGDYGAAVELDEEMEAKDAHLHDVASRRRESLTALDWGIEPDAHAPQTALKAAAEAAQFCEETLRAVRTFDKTLEHLALAVGPGISATELIWWRGRLVETNDLHGSRLNSGPEQRGIWVATDDDMLYGVEARSPKFVVHAPDARAGFPLRVSITRAGATLWVVKHFVTMAWTGYVEVFGQPIRIAKTRPNVTEEEQKRIIDMLEKMVTDTWGMFSDAVDIQFLEAAKHNQPYEGMMEWIESKQSILYLGQTLTTEQQTVGALSLGKVHANVRASITRSDIAKEARTLRQQVLAPMVRFRWPGQNVPVPFFVRRIAEDADIEAQNLMLAKLNYARSAGLAVDPEDEYELLKLPKPKPKEPASVTPP